MLVRLFVACLVLSLGRLPAWAVTYYVAVGGSGTTCTQAQSSTTPHNTIAEGITCLGPGDTLNIRGGIYNELLEYTSVSWPSGTGWGAGQVITIQSQPGERAILRPSSTSGGIIYLRDDGFNPAAPTFIQYLHFLNLTVDASLAGGDLWTYRLEQGARNIRVEGNTIINSPDGNGIGLGGYHSGTPSNENAPYATNFEFLNNDICCAGAYGVYHSGNHDTFDGNTIRDNVGYGIHSYSDWLYIVHDNTFTRNILANNSTAPGGATGSNDQMIAFGAGGLIANNVVYGGGSVTGVGIRVGWTYREPRVNEGNTRVYNNTVAHNDTASACIRFDPDTPGTNYARNNICWGNTANGILDQRGEAFISDNLLTSDPLFVNAGAGDYRLGPGSPAMGAGVPLAEVTHDASVPPVARPQPPGGAYDLGAFEATSVPTPTLNTFYGAASGPPNTDCLAATSATTPYIVTNAASLGGFLSCGLGSSTFVLAAGTYVASLVSSDTPMASGSAGSPTTLQAASGATVTLKSSTGGAVIYLNRGALDHHLTFDRLILDGDNTVGVNGLVTTSGVHHLTMRDSEIKEMYYQALGIDGTSDVEILRSNIHDGGGGAGAPLVQIIGSSNVHIAESTVAASLSGVPGIDVSASSTGVLIERSTVRNNTGIGLRVAGSTVTLQNSLLYQNSKGVQFQTGTSASKAYYNTVWSNTGECFLFDAGVTTSEAKNNICWANGSAIVNNAGGGVVTTPNHTADPSFVSTTPGAAGFLRLGPTSTARETATPIAGVTNDFAGTSRPLGPIPDQGAFEETPVAAPPATVGLVPPYRSTHFLLSY